MVRAWPRSGISVNSVTPGLCCCLLYSAAEMAVGTVWSFAPEMISSGPRSGLRMSTLSSVSGLRFAAAAWNSGRRGRVLICPELSGQRICG
jgi:hypothetical protein